jgi:hypothetical protein
VRRLLAWIGGVLGGIAAWRYFRRRSEAVAPQAPQAPPVAEADPRAEALRAKLDEAREAEPEVEAGPEAPEEQEASSAAEPEPEPEPEVADPEERRRSVHDHGRAALEEMRAGDGDEASSSS